MFQIQNPFTLRVLSQSGQVGVISACCPCCYGADPASAIITALGHQELEVVDALQRNGAPLDFVLAAATGRAEEVQRLLPTAASEDRHRAPGMVMRRSLGCCSMRAKIPIDITPLESMPIRRRCIRPPHGVTTWSSACWWYALVRRLTPQRCAFETISVGCAKAISQDFLLVLKLHHFFATL